MINYKLGPGRRMAFVICPNKYSLHGNPAGTPVPRYVIIFGGNERSFCIDDPSWETLKRYRDANLGIKPRHVMKSCEWCRNHIPPEFKLLKS